MWTIGWALDKVQYCSKRASLTHLQPVVIKGISHWIYTNHIGPLFWIQNDQLHLKVTSLHHWEETCLGQETQAMDIRPVEICPNFWFLIFDSNHHVFVRRRVGERIISPCVVPTVKHGEGGVRFSPDLTALDQHKNIPWRSALASNSPRDMHIFREVRNKYTQAVRKVKASFFKQKFASCSTNSKRFWDTVESIRE